MAMFKQSRARQLVIEIGIALILAVVARVAWNQFYVPTRPVVQVGEQTINRREYQELVEIDLAQQLAYIQNGINRYEQMLGTEGANNQSAAATIFGQDHQEALQLREQVVQDLKTVKSGQVDTGLIDYWASQEVILQGAARENIAVSDEEVAAALVKSFTEPAEDEHAHGHSHGEEASEEPAHDPDHGAETAEEHGHDEAEHSEEATAADPAAAQTILTDAYTGLTRLLKDDYGVTVGFSQESFENYIKRQQRVGLLSKRLEQKLMPDDQAPTSLQVHGQYLLLLTPTPTLTNTDSVTGTATLDDPIKAEADALYQQAKDGADFLTLAKEHSVNPEETVDPGWTVPDSFWPPLKEAVLTQPLGEVGPPIKTPSGWYIVKMLERAERPDKQKLEQERTKRFQEWDAQQRSALGIKRF